MRLHTWSVFIWYMNANVLRNFRLKQPSRARIRRFELKITYFSEEFYEVYIIWVEYMYLTMELTLICWFERHLRMHTKFQLQCQMIYLKNIATTLQNCILYTTIDTGVMVTASATTYIDVYCKSLLSRIHVVNTQPMCKHFTWMHNKIVNSNRICG